MNFAVIALPEQHPSTSDRFLDFRRTDIGERRRRHIFGQRFFDCSQEPDRKAIEAAFTTIAKDIRYQDQRPFVMFVERPDPDLATVEKPANVEQALRVLNLLHRANPGLGDEIIRIAGDALEEHQAAIALLSQPPQEPAPPPAPPAETPSSDELKTMDALPADEPEQTITETTAEVSNPIVAVVTEDPAPVTTTLAPESEPTPADVTPTPPSVTLDSPSVTPAPEEAPPAGVTGTLPDIDEEPAPAPTPPPAPAPKTAAKKAAKKAAAKKAATPTPAPAAE